MEKIMEASYLEEDGVIIKVYKWQGKYILKFPSNNKDNVRENGSNNVVTRKLARNDTTFSMEIVTRAVQWLNIIGLSLK